MQPIDFNDPVELQRVINLDIFLEKLISWMDLHHVGSTKLQEALIHQPEFQQRLFVKSQKSQDYYGGTLLSVWGDDLDEPKEVDRVRELLDSILKKDTWAELVDHLMEVFEILNQLANDPNIQVTENFNQWAKGLYVGGGIKNQTEETRVAVRDTVGIESETAPKYSLHLEEDCLAMTLQTGLWRAWHKERKTSPKESHAIPIDEWDKVEKRLLAEFKGHQIEPAIQNFLKLLREVQKGIREQFNVRQTDAVEEAIQRAQWIIDYLETCGIPGISPYIEVLRNFIEQYGKSRKSSLIILHPMRMEEPQEALSTSGLYATSSVPRIEKKGVNIVEAQRGLDELQEFAGDLNDMLAVRAEELHGMRMSALDWVYNALTIIRGFGKKFKLGGVGKNSFLRQDPERMGEGILELYISQKELQLPHDSELHCSEPILVYRALLRLATHIKQEDFDPLNKEHRTRLERGLVNITGGRFLDQKKHLIGQLFRRADELFCEDIATHEMLTNFAKSEEAFEPERKRKNEERVVGEIKAKIERALTSCRDEALYVASDVQGEVDMSALRPATKAIRKLYIHRVMPDQVWPSNISCNGYFEIEIDNITHRLPWALSDNGTLTLFYQNVKVTDKDLSESPNFTRMVLEFQRLVVQGLEQCLVRDMEEVRGMEIADVRRGIRINTGEPIRKAKGVSIAPPQRVVRARVDRLFGKQEGGKTGEFSKTTIADKARYIDALLDKMRAGETLSRKDLEPVYLCYGETVQNKEGEEVIVPIPLEPIDALMALRDGSLKRDKVLLMGSARGFVKAGYHPYLEDDEGKVLHVVPRNPSPTSELLSEVVQSKLGINLSSAALRDTTEIRIQPTVERIVFETRARVEGVSEDTEVLEFTMGQLIELAEQAKQVGVEHPHIAGMVRGVSEDGTSGRIERVVFRAKQLPQFRAGQWVSLEDALKN